MEGETSSNSLSHRGTNTNLYVLSKTILHSFEMYLTQEIRMNIRFVTGNILELLVNKPLDFREDRLYAEGATTAW